MAKLTQKEKLQEAFKFALMVKGKAHSLKFDSIDYDVKFGVQIAEDLISKCEEFIKKI